MHIAHSIYLLVAKIGAHMSESHIDQLNGKNSVCMYVSISGVSRKCNRGVLVEVE